MLEGGQANVIPTTPHSPHVVTALQDLDCISLEISQVTTLWFAEALSVVRIIHGAATLQPMRSVLPQKA